MLVYLTVPVHLCMLVYLTVPELCMLVYLTVPETVHVSVFNCA